MAALRTGRSGGPTQHSFFFRSAFVFKIHNTRKDSSGRLAGAPYLRNNPNNNMKNNKKKRNKDNNNKNHKSGGSSLQGDGQPYSYEV